MNAILEPFRRRPWLAVVLGFAAFVTVSMTFLAISIRNMPTLLH